MSKLARNSGPDPSIATEDDEKALVEAAYLYYQEDRTQQEIAETFGVSRFTVGRWLKRAREIGLVRIEIVASDAAAAAVGARLERALGLRRCVVVSTESGASPSEVRRRIGEAGARCLEGLLRDGQTISVPWGRTLAEMAARLRPQVRVGVTVCELMGGVGQISEGFAAHEVAARLAERVQGRCAYLPAPVVVADAATRDVLLGEPSIRRTLKLAERSDLAVLGIGAPTADLILVVSGLIEPEDIERIARDSAVADVAGWFIDGAGRELATPFSDRTIALALEKIRAIPTKVVVAGGASKVAGIVGAARGGLMDVLVTDSATAEAALSAVDPGGAARA